MKKMVQIGVGCALVVMATGCSRNDPREGLTGGTLVFSDEFDGEEISDAWQAEGETWRVEGGVLRGRNAQNDALWLVEALPESFRVEFDARALTATGDIKFEVLGDGATHESGYIGIFGGWNNSLNIIARLDEHGDDRLIGAPDARVEQGETYRMAVARTGDVLRWFVDGEPFLAYRDGAPLPLEGGGHFGFNNWQAPVEFDNVHVFDLSQ